MSSVAEEFWSIYKKEWKEARKALRVHKHDEEIIYLLMQIVRGVYDFCQDEVKTGSHHKKRKSEELTEEYIHHKLPVSFDRDHVTQPVKTYIHRCIQCLRHMCTSKTGMYIYWIPKGDMIDKEKFDVDGNKEEHICDWTVWPAVIGDDGTVLKKGIVIPV